LSLLLLLILKLKSCHATATHVSGERIYSSYSFLKLTLDGSDHAVYVIGLFRPVAGIAGSNPALGMCLYIVLSCVGRGLSDELITHPKEPYHVSNKIRETSKEKAMDRSGLERHKDKAVVVKSRKLRYGWHTARIDEKRNVNGIQLGKYCETATCKTEAEIGGCHADESHELM
jgi:hypothetical protein